MRITLKTLTGQDFSLEVSPFCTIVGLKGLLQEESGVPPDQVRLIYAGSQLQDSFTLSDYNILPDSTIHVVLRMRGGGGPIFLPDPRMCKENRFRAPSRSRGVVNRYLRASSGMNLQFRCNRTETPFIIACGYGHFNIEKDFFVFFCPCCFQSVSQTDFQCFIFCACMMSFRGKTWETSRIVSGTKDYSKPDRYFTTTDLNGESGREWASFEVWVRGVDEMRLLTRKKAIEREKEARRRKKQREREERERELLKVADILSPERKEDPRRSLLSVSTRDVGPMENEPMLGRKVIGKCCLCFLNGRKDEGCLVCQGDRFARLDCDSRVCHCSCILHLHCWRSYRDENESEYILHCPTPDCSGFCSQICFVSASASKIEYFDTVPMDLRPESQARVARIEDQQQQKRFRKMQRRKERLRAQMKESTASSCGDSRKTNGTLDYREKTNGTPDSSLPAAKEPTDLTPLDSVPDAIVNYILQRIVGRPSATFHGVIDEYNGKTGVGVLNAWVSEKIPEFGVLRFRIPGLPEFDENLNGLGRGAPVLFQCQEVKVGSSSWLKVTSLEDLFADELWTT